MIDQVAMLESIKTRFPVDFYDSAEEATERWSEMLAEEIEEQEAFAADEAVKNEESAAAAAKEAAIYAKAREIAAAVGGVAHKAFSGSCYVMVDDAEVARVSDHRKPHGADASVEQWLWKNGKIEKVVLLDNWR